MKRLSRAVRVGNLEIGGNNPIAVQSMTNIDTADIPAVTEQLKALQAAGCHIVRFAVNSMEAVKAIPVYKTVTDMPLVADIHFDYRLAVEAAEAGIDKIRINPGNIGAEENIKAVVNACRQKNIPIRIGINGGSLEKDLLAKYGSPTAEAIAESALNNARILEKYDFDNIVLSVKSSDVIKMIRANEIIAEKCGYPLHLGVTEAGGEENGTIRNSIGIGALLAKGIGDTMRVSLTADPVKEVYAAHRILRVMGMESGINVVSCPTCGRTKIDLIPLASRVEKLCEGIKTDKYVTVAVMGCVVNGPGEAREADVGIAGGNGEAVLFRKGVVIGKIKEAEIETILKDEIMRIINE